MFYLLDKNLNRVDVIENYQSFIWVTKYYEDGEFDLYVPASKDVFTKFQIGYYISRTDDWSQAMVIESIGLETSFEDGDYIPIKGRSLKSLLHKRIVWDRIVFSGNVETLIRKIITDNCINPTDSKRQITKLELGSTIGLTDTIKIQISPNGTGDDIPNVLKDICKVYGIGYDIKLDIVRKKFIFVIYKGTDRSLNQNVNPRVTFSDTFENVLTMKYKFNTKDFKTMAFIKGEDIDDERFRVAYYGNDATDLDRSELFVDARDIRSDDGEGGTIPAEDYTLMLIQRGLEKLNEYMYSEEISGEVEPNYQYKINEDYFLGDIVTFKNNYGLTMFPRITEIIETFDRDGYSIIPTFDNESDE